MDKYFQLHGKTAEGRPLIHLFEPGSGYGLEASAGLEKCASGEHLPEVLELVNSIKAEPGRLYLVNSALGAGEWVGFNLRGDWFTERGLVHEPRGWKDIPVWDVDARRRAAAQTEHASPHGELAWGYPTFYNASRYQHHANKEPDKARGFILGAFWDPRMHRVVLVSELVRARCEQFGGADVYDRIARGEFCDTSMGAKVPDDRCFPAGTLVRTAKGYRPIEDLEAGDVVATLEHHQRPVDAPMVNLFTGTMITIKPGGLREIESTARHPYFVLKREDVRSCIGSANGRQRRHLPDETGKKCSFCHHVLGWKTYEVRAEDVRVGDYLVAPTHADNDIEMTPEAAYALGVFAGDGFVVRQKTGKKKDGPYRDMGIGFSCGYSDPHIERLLHALSTLSSNEACLYQEADEKQALRITLYDQGLSTWMQNLVGSGWAGKGLKFGVFGDQETRLHFLGGCIDSDGSFDAEKGSTRFVSANRALAHDVWQTCICSGIAASLGKQRSTGGYSETDIWVVFIPSSYATLLSGYSDKIRPTTAHVSTKGFFWNGYFCVPVEAVAEHEVEDLPVHNLDVTGDDETYIAGGVAVHNCAICNNRAKSPALYCEHVRANAIPPYGMRSILPDGRMCGVYNDYPRFFDDSFVFIGAERSAKVMANVTGRVRGNNAYTDKLYQPGVRDLSSREHVADIPLTGRDDQDMRLGHALQDVNESHVRGPQENHIGAAISRAISAIPVLDKSEERALQHAAEIERKRAALKDRTLTDAEFRFWKAKADTSLHGEGIATDQRARALALLRAKTQALGEEKLGSLAKWAEMMKEIPVPSSTQSALVRDHASRLTSVLPRGIVEGAQSPDELWDLLSQLGHLGIVLRPEEFQDGMLCSMGRGADAVNLRGAGSVFAPTPLDPEAESPWCPRPPQPDVLSRLSDVLGDAFCGRSFAPKIIAIRITQQGSAPTSSDGSCYAGSRTPLPDPILNRVSQMYNDYRTGLLTRPPDWRYVPSPAASATLREPAKVGDAANSLSLLLLHLAYW